MLGENLNGQKPLVEGWVRFSEDKLGLLDLHVISFW